jgi:hypothetical protein
MIQTPAGATHRCERSSRDPRDTRVASASEESPCASPWIDTKTGAVAKRDVFAHEGGRRDLASPPYEQDVALRLVQADPVR